MDTNPVSIDKNLACVWFCNDGWQNVGQVFRAKLLQEFQYDLWCLFEDQGDITEVIGQRYAQLCKDARQEALNRGRLDHEEAVDANQ